MLASVVHVMWTHVSYELQRMDPLCFLFCAMREEHVAHVYYVLGPGFVSTSLVNR